MLMSSVTHCLFTLVAFPSLGRGFMALSPAPKADILQYNIAEVTGHSCSLPTKTTLTACECSSTILAAHELLTLSRCQGSQSNSSVLKDLSSQWTTEQHAYPTP